jgi:hypothetical protein
MSDRDFRNKAIGWAMRADRILREAAGDPVEIPMCMPAPRSPAPTARCCRPNRIEHP